jgi:hypothetical protein
VRATSRIVALSVSVVSLLAVAGGNAAAATRALAVPLAVPVGSSNALTVDAAPDSGIPTEHFDSANHGAVGLNGSTLTGSLGSDKASVSIPTVPGAGTYPIGTDPVTSLDLVSGGHTCASETGSLTVDDAVYSGSTPTVFSASYQVSCAGQPAVYGDIHWHSTETYRDLVVDPEVVSDAAVTVGSTEYVDISVANFGSAALHVGGPIAFSGPDAADWSADDAQGCLNRTYTALSACTVYLLFTPTAGGHRTATATIADTSARGEHTISLDGIGEVAPSAPATTAMVAVHRAQVTWAASDDGGAPVYEYRVFRTIPGQPQQLVATVTPKTPDVGGSYVDTGIPTGVTYQYAVIATNAAGDGPDADVSATPPSDELLLDGTRAMSTGGSEPLQVANPAVRGRVAVVPGSNRIIYPAAYPGGAVDLATASPYATVSQARLTTMGATDPAVSMDGTTIAFVHVDGSGHPSIWTMPVGGGTPARRAGGVTNPAWLPDGRTLVAERSTQTADPVSGADLVTVTPDGTVSDIPGTTDGHEPAVSPDGQRIAYQMFDQGTGTYSLAVVPIAGGAPQTSSATTAAPIEDVSWRTDGKRLFAAEGGKVRAASYSTGAGPGSLTTISPSDVSGVRWPAYVNSEAVSLVQPPPVTGKRASVRIETADGASSTCSLDGGTSSPCNRSWNSVVNLAKGAHTLVVTSTPSTGVGSTVSWTFTVDTQRPTVTLHSPAAMVTRGRHLRIAYSGHDNVAVASYDVRYRDAVVHHKLGRYRYPRSWQATTGRVQHLRLKPGREYCVSVRSRDTAGNVSTWSAPRCTRTPK